jgi:hypothetical protein
MMKFAPFALAVLLGGCETVHIVPAVAPADAMRECPPARKVPKPPVDMGQLLDYTIGQVQDYKECRARHKALINYNRKG